MRGAGVVRDQECEARDDGAHHRNRNRTREREARVPELARDARGHVALVRTTEHHDGPAVRVAQRARHVDEAIGRPALVPGARARLQTDERPLGAVEQCIGDGRVFGPEREIGLRAERTRTEERGEREQCVDFPHAARQRERGVEAAGAIGGPHETDRRARAEQQGEGIRAHAGAVHLNREVERLAVHAREEVRREAGIEELLGDAGKAGEGLEAIDVRGARGEIAHHGERNERDLRMRQRGAQRAEGRRRADEVADARGAHEHDAARRLGQSREETGGEGVAHGEACTSR
ncbi:MAG TPA: hypothetical protein VF166_11960 [Gemmatimonadaceae bacterium]